MKKLLITIPFMFLVGCVSVPVERNFPKAPAALLVAPPDLREVPANASATEVFDVVLDNYGSYHTVADELRAWQQWYVGQKKIFESVQ